MEMNGILNIFAFKRLSFKNKLNLEKMFIVYLCSIKICIK